MRIEDAYRKLPEYIDGALTAAERAEMEQFLAQDPDFKAAYMISRRLESALQSQVWLAPSPNFTHNLLLSIEPVAAPMASGWSTAWEKVKVALSAAALLAMLVFYGKSLMEWSGAVLSDAGSWLGMVTGYSLFALHPVIVLGLIAPILAGGYATCVLTGRCKLTV